jgi:UDP-glucose:O-linked fucose beta-1,3-glucosyltransferase
VNIYNSTSSLTEYLGCFDSNDYIYLGERYGYDLFSDDNGYNYITGGGGIVFNLKTVKKIVESCSCPSPSSPDDMIIASCLKQFEIEPIHSTLFHQARPKDYPKAVLDLSSRSISFHKFWQIDPIDEYSRWFRKRDEEYYAINKHLNYKYLKRECLSTSSASSDCYSQNSNQNDMSRVEL